MKRVLRSFIIACVFSAAALAQEHKISVQKFEAPKYPTIARQARVQGPVVLQFDVGSSGAAENIRVISGHPMLQQAAVDNVKLWRFHCDDCGYGQSFHHTMVFDFRLGDDNLVSNSVVYKFPGRVTRYAEQQQLIVMGVLAISRPKYFWLWKLFHPRSWRFHDFDHDF
jgi:TonB family protein